VIAEIIASFLPLEGGVICYVDDSYYVPQSHRPLIEKQCPDCEGKGFTGKRGWFWFKGTYKQCTTCNKTGQVAIDFPHKLPESPCTFSIDNNTLQFSEVSWDYKNKSWDTHSQKQVNVVLSEYIVKLDPAETVHKRDQRRENTYFIVENVRLPCKDHILTDGENVPKCYQCKGKGCVCGGTGYWSCWNMKRVGYCCLCHNSDGPPFIKEVTLKFYIRGAGLTPELFKIC